MRPLRAEDFQILIRGDRFDIPSFDFKDEDEPGMLKSMRSLNELITTEVDSGIPAERVVLGGFSQGGAMSLLTGLTTERKLGGVVVLSGWLPLKDKFKAVCCSLSSCIVYQEYIWGILFSSRWLLTM